MPVQAFDFEKPMIALFEAVEKIEAKPRPWADEDEEQLEVLREQLRRVQREVYHNLTPWQRVQVARHISRPHALDYIHALVEGFEELSGDRAFGDDPAMICGLGLLNGRRVAVIGQQKGADTRENLRRNFGMAHPEGYRKALRVMQMANKFRLPIVIFIDTPGAYPGIGAEERGQAEAIARNIREMATFDVPIVSVVIGEGASGGALGVGVSDCILMLENSWYCVISPEGCAAILWKDRAKAPEVAEALKLTAKDLLELGVCDEIIEEPAGGAHRYPAETFANVGKVIDRWLTKLARKSSQRLLDDRYNKYRAMGSYEELTEEAFEELRALRAPAEESAEVEAPASAPQES
jgi:acetyl-CoA carboxylase carboxyl transferase subunit alpha